MKAWHIGNTTVRSPYRLKEALLALKSSEFHGNLNGKEQENGFTRLLHEKEVVKVERLNREESGDASDLGRKWRSAAVQLGFLSQKLIQEEAKLLFKQEHSREVQRLLDQSPYRLTANGLRLIQAEMVAEMQEAFLRSAIAYRIPSIIETRYKDETQPFSPLRFLLSLLLQLEKQGTRDIVTLEEMALFVQQRSPDDGIHQVVAEILQYRQGRENASHKKKYDRDYFEQMAGENRNAAGTWRDYADLNFRYFKATGMFESRHRGIGILAEKRTLARLLVEEGDGKYDNFDYIETLWHGAVLPTDDRLKAIEIVNDLGCQLVEQGENIQPEIFSNLGSLTLDELSKRRYGWEERLWQLKELAYAREQMRHGQNIVEFLKIYGSGNLRRTVRGVDGEEWSIPSGEAPAYLEWLTWRAFLALGFNSLENPPWEARKFKIDQDFLPLSHAPGGGPDLEFVFPEYVLVVEVTMLGGSRQEAAEGEPVRRHVAKLAEYYENSGKRVYCLFLAPTIDSNTAETFKIGNWYKSDDTRLPLHIVPVTLEDFVALLEAGFKSDRGGLSPEELMKLLIICRSLNNSDAPEWKKEIHNEINRFLNSLGGFQETQASSSI